MDTMQSSKGKSLIVDNGYKFRFHRMLLNEVQRWTCCQNTFKCFLKVSPNLEILERSNEHNHQKCDNDVLDREKLSSSGKVKAIDSISTPPSKLIQAELKRGDMPAIKNKDLKSVKNNIDARRARHPKLPRSTVETQNALNEMDLTTNTGENFLFLNDLRNNIIGFSTNTNLIALSSVNRIYIDGTFKSCPKYFTHNSYLRFMDFTTDVMFP